jgi:hypothetical protein
VKIEPRDLDRRPGEPPLIRSREGSIIYDFPRGRLVQNSRLVVRCDADGEVWVAIVAGDRPLPTA